MDQVTHLVSGLIQGKFFSLRTYSNKTLLLCVLAAMIPDIDIIALTFGRDQYLIHHRGLSHAIPMAFFWAISLALTLRENKRDKLIRNSFIALFCVLGHIYLDLMTSYGTAILTPFSKERYSTDAMFIIDPIYWAILLITYIIIRLTNLSGRSIFNILLAVWLIYPASNLVLRKHIEYNLRTEIYSNKIASHTDKDIRVIPDFLTPIYWKVIEYDRNSAILSYYNLFSKKLIKIENFNKIDISQLKFANSKDSFLSFYLDKFLRFPVIRSDTNYIEILDLRFYHTSSYLPYLRQNSVPFSVILWVNKEGEVLSYIR